jgi:Uma2 family endonuclease
MPMNIRAPLPERATQAAVCLPRRAFTVAEVERMAEVGLLHEDDRVELIGGELVVMSPKGYRHEILKELLLRRWMRALPDDLFVMPETIFRLAGDTFLEPDLLVWRKPVTLETIRGDNVLLAVEIADSSLGYDLGRKPAIYAQAGVRELWVIDAVQRDSHVHRRPAEDGYGEVRRVPAGEAITPLLAPELGLTLERPGRE